MNPCTRIFLDWKQPPPRLAADWLFSQTRDGSLDLSATLVVVPGARAGRILLGMLVELTQDQGVAFSPPVFVTPGELPDALLFPSLSRTQPGPILTKLAWIEALRSLPPEELSGLIPVSHSHDNRDRIEAWTGVAHSLRQCHEDLSAEGLTFARVPELAASLPHFEEADRWIAAQRVQARYVETLNGWGYTDPALDRLGAPAPDAGGETRQVVLVGITELSSVAKRALSTPGLAVTSLVMAPDAEQSSFDTWGAIDPRKWGVRPVPIASDQVEFAESPAEQAELALGFLAALGPCISFEVTVGVPDASVVPPLERAGVQAGATLRAATGDPLSQTPPGKLILLLLAFLNGRTWSSLCDLLRHPDLEQTLEQSTPALFARCGGLRRIEAFRETHLRNEIDEGPIHHEAAEILRCIEELLGALASPEVRPLTQWPSEVMRVLAQIYAHIPLDPRHEAERLAVEACRLIKSQLTPLARHTGPSCPVLTGREFLTLFCEENQNATIPPALAQDAVELLGWLELWMDPSRAVVVTGMNEGMVPPAGVADPLLPDALRTRLGLPCDASRLAREVFLATHLVHSRERLLFVAGRRDAEGSPLIPSRLLFATNASQIATRLALLSHAEAPAHARRVAIIAPASPGGNRFPLHPRIQVRIPTELPVTAFKQYMNSPYRFYLEQVLRLSEKEEPGLEMDHGRFGEIIHRALHAFAKGPHRDATRESDIRSALMHALDEQVASVLGGDLTTPVWLQIESARRRLLAFASSQAEHRDEGWSIAYTEWTPGDGVRTILVDGEPFGLRGRIDRIDRHADGRMAIFDYKTSDRPVKPESAFNKGEWLDLQLPLYRHLAAEILPPSGLDRVCVGYISLPRESGETAIIMPPWTGPDFNLADKQAHEVIRAIRRAEFDSLGTVYRSQGALDALCGIGILGVEPPAVEELKS